MKLLVIGGGVFLGKALVLAAIRRGHQVTMFNRGQTTKEVSPGVEWIKGDRNKNLHSLKHWEWDAAIDTCGFVPRQVRLLLEAIGDRIGHYTFISSISAYADLGLCGVSENAPLAALLEPSEERITENTYGPLKGACEMAAQNSGVRSVLVVRPGIIVGPGDPTGRFAYWVARVARSGEILAPGDFRAKLQLIDVRDLAVWLVTLVEQRISGVYNAVGSSSLTWGEMLAICARELSCRPKFTWVSDSFITERAIADWSNLPLYISEKNRAFAGLFQVEGMEAFRHGLELRPLSKTVVDTSRWICEDSPRAQVQLGLTPKRETELLLAWQRTLTEKSANIRAHRV